MKKMLFLGLTERVLGRDALLDSMVELLDVPSCRKSRRLPSRCPSVCRVVLRTEPDNMKYMMGSKQLLKADSRSSISFVLSTICRILQWARSFIW